MKGEGRMGNERLKKRGRMEEYWRTGKMGASRRKDLSSRWLCHFHIMKHRKKTSLPSDRQGCGIYLHDYSPRQSSM